MTRAKNNADFFTKLAKLPPKVITIIIDELPKCILAELLYFPSIREVVASTILSNVNITEGLQRHGWNYEPDVGYADCNCVSFNIEFGNLKKGINQWNIYPKVFHMKGLSQFVDVLLTCPELLTKTSSVNSTFSGLEDTEVEILEKLLMDSNIKFDYLSLSEFPDPITLSPIVKNILLLNTTLISYVIPGVKKLDIVFSNGNEEGQNYVFASDLEELTIKDDRFTQLNLPPNLRKLSIESSLGSVNIISKELVNLEYLQLKELKIASFDETGITAPNLKTLNLENCQNITDFTGLRRFQKLKYISLKGCVFPAGLLEEGLFPELEIFEYSGKDFEPESEYDGPLPLPANLKHVSIKWASSVIIDLNTFVLPSRLKHLELWDIRFSQGHLQFNEDLEYVRIRTRAIRFPGDFRIPPLVKHFQIKATHLCFYKPDFMYHLLDGLNNLQLVCPDLGRMDGLDKIVQWPESLKVFRMHYLGLNSHSLQLWNFKESNLEEIDFRGGALGQLNADALPTSLKVLTMKNLRIEELVGSFGNLKKLEKLILGCNDIKYVSFLEFPSLKFLDLGYCKFDLIPPVTVMFLNQKLKELKLYSKTMDVTVLKQDICLDRNFKRVKRDFMD